MDEPIGVPMRIRDFTFPSFLVLDLPPTPAAPLGKGRYAVEFHFSEVNSFQTSSAVRDYLQDTRGNGSRSLDENDAAFIVGLAGGNGFFVDSEFDYYELAAHFGLTNRIDLSLSLPYIHYTGGELDATIYNFHGTFHISQEGRTLVEDDRFQFVVGANRSPLFIDLKRPSRGGFLDPYLSVRYAFPRNLKGWRFNVAGAVKPPLANINEFLSTGSWDFGVMFTVDKRLRQNAFIINVAGIFPGPFQRSENLMKQINPHALPTIDGSWLHRFKRLANVRFFLQILSAQHPLHEEIRSDFTDVEIQATTGFKWNTKTGVWGIGITENLFYMDNTPDIGINFSWGMLSR